MPTEGKPKVREIYRKPAEDMVAKEYFLKLVREVKRENLMWEMIPMQYAPGEEVILDLRSDEQIRKDTGQKPTAAEIETRVMGGAINAKVEQATAGVYLVTYIDPHGIIRSVVCGEKELSKIV